MMMLWLWGTVGVTLILSSYVTILYLLWRESETLRRIEARGLSGRVTGVPVAVVADLEAGETWVTSDAEVASLEQRYQEESAQRAPVVRGWRGLRRRSKRSMG